MKIGIVSNLHERCGNAQYGRDLRDSLSRFYDITFTDNVEGLINSDISAVIFNWHPARVTITPELIKRFQEKGIKVIIILQNSFEWRMETHANDAIFLADAIVAHEKMDSNARVTVIPHGIPEVGDLSYPSEMKIGTAGFPFDWKRFDVVAEAAKRLNVKCCMIAPKHPDQDTDRFVEGLRGHLGPLAEIHKDWMPVEEVVRLLSSCTLNIFWFESRHPDDQLGQSGSVRLGIAAKRPIIVSTHRKMRTVLPYLDEIYMAVTEHDVYHYATEILRNPYNAKIPNRIIKEMGWNRTGEMYRDLIESLFFQDSCERRTMTA